jgi:hypothetical protein
MPRPPQKTRQLVVEGKNDQHVIWALCEQHRVAETFSVLVPGKDGAGGIEALLADIPVRLKQRGLEMLGVVVDANQDLLGRWQAITDRLKRSGYENVPPQPDTDGLIISAPSRPQIGVWLMPDNQLPGMLEDFVAHLIPGDDLLAPKAKACLCEIEQEGLNLYKSIHQPKAFIHTWLAWQENPGLPMGQAITAHALGHNKPLALAFVGWLGRLFA